MNHTALPYAHGSHTHRLAGIIATAWVCGVSSVHAVDPGVLDYTAPVFAVEEPVEALATRAVTVSVARTEGSAGAVRVDYCCWIADGLDTAESYSTATSPSGTLYYYRDVSSTYVQRSGTLSWADGETNTKIFTVSLTADAFRLGTNAAVATPRIEGTKTLSLVLANPGGGARLGPNASAQLHILDAQPPPAGALHVARPWFFGGEHAGVARITVRRTGGALGAVSVSYAVNSNVPLMTLQTTNHPRATPGVDYARVSGTLSWADGDTGDKSFDVPIFDDATQEGPESANLALFDARGGAQLGWPTNALLVIVDDDRDLADIPLPRLGNDMRIWYPRRAPSLNGLFVYMAGTGGDSRWVANYRTDWKGSIREWRFAVMGTRIGTFVSAGPGGIGPFLDIMRLCGASIGRPELCNAPCMFTGYSLGGIYSAYAAMALPERTVGWAGYMGGNALTYRTPGIEHVPSLFIAGQNDGNTIVGAPQLRNMFVSWRTNGCAASYAVSWNVAHNDNAGQNYEMGLLFLNEALRTRYPTNQIPGRAPGQTVTLNTLDQSQCWLAQTPVHNAPVWDVAIDAATNFPLDPSTASCLPSEAAAHYFRAFTSLYPGYYPSSFPSEIPFQSPPQMLAPAVYAIVTPDASVTLSMNYRVSPAPTNVTFALNAAPFASSTSAPWSASITLSNAPGGAYGASVMVRAPATQPLYAFRMFSVQTPERCARPTRLAAHPAGPAAIGLVWQDNASDETGFSIARLNTNAMPELIAAVPANTTMFVDTNPPPDATSVYCVRAFNALGESAWSDDAAATPGAFTWSGRGPNAYWSSGANWLADAVPGDAAAIIFPEKDTASTYASGRSISVFGTVQVARITLGGSAPGTGWLTLSGSSASRIMFANDAALTAGPHASTNTISCPLHLGTDALSCHVSAGLLTLSGAISDATPAAFAKHGAGTLILGGVNSHRGGTLVHDGTVLLAALSNACGSGPVSVAEPATLIGSTAIHGALSNAGSVVPGPYTGTLRVAELWLAPSSRLTFELGALDKGYDQIVAGGNAHIAGSLAVTSLNHLVYGIYTLIASSGTLTQSDLTLEVHAGSLDVEWLTNSSDGIRIALTPEPACCALAALVCLILRRSV